MTRHHLLRSTGATCDTRRGGHDVVIRVCQTYVNTAAFPGQVTIYVQTCAISMHTKAGDAKQVLANTWCRQCGLRFISSAMHDK